MATDDQELCPSSMESSSTPSNTRRQLFSAFCEIPDCRMQLCVLPFWLTKSTRTTQSGSRLSRLHFSRKLREMLNDCRTWLFEVVNGVMQWTTWQAICARLEWLSCINEFQRVATTIITIEASQHSTQRFIDACFPVSLVSHVFLEGCGNPAGKLNQISSLILLLS
jgi:hypothetical protein